MYFPIFTIIHVQWYKYSKWNSNETEWNQHLPANSNLYSNCIEAKRKKTCRLKCSYRGIGLTEHTWWGSGVVFALPLPLVWGSGTASERGKAEQSWSEGPTSWKRECSCLCSEEIRCHWTPAQIDIQRETEGGREGGASLLLWREMRERHCARDMACYRWWKISTAVLSLVMR